MSDKQKGVMYIVLSAFFFALMAMFVKLAGDLPSTQKSFFRNLIAMIISMAIIIKDGYGFHYKKENLIPLFLRASFGTVGILANFYAVDHLLLSDASMLQKLSPFFVILFSYFILKEKVSIKQMLFVLIAFLSALLVIKPSFSNTSLFASIIAIIGAMGAGMAYTLVRLLTNRGEDKPKIVFFFSAFSTIILLPMLIIDYKPMTYIQLIYLLLAGVAASIGQFAVTNAYSYGSGKEISIYDYSQVIFSAIMGLIAFGQVPDIYSFIGYILIFAVAIINYKYNLRNEE